MSCLGQEDPQAALVPAGFQAPTPRSLLCRLWCHRPRLVSPAGGHADSTGGEYLQQPPHDGSHQGRLASGKQQRATWPATAGRIEAPAHAFFPRHPPHPTHHCRLVAPRPPTHLHSIPAGRQWGVANAGRNHGQPWRGAQLLPRTLCRVFDRSYGARRADGHGAQSEGL